MLSLRWIVKTIYNFNYFLVVELEKTELGSGNLTDFNIFLDKNEKSINMTYLMSDNLDENMIRSVENKVNFERHLKRKEQKDLRFVNLKNECVLSGEEIEQVYFHSFDKF